LQLILAFLICSVAPPKVERGGSLKSLCLDTVARLIIEETEEEPTVPLDLSVIPSDVAQEIMGKLQHHGIVTCDMLR